MKIMDIGNAQKKYQIHKLFRSNHLSPVCVLLLYGSDTSAVRFHLVVSRPKTKPATRAGPDS